MSKTKLFTTSKFIIKNRKINNTIKKYLYYFLVTFFNLEGISISIRKNILFTLTTKQRFYVSAL